MQGQGLPLMKKNGGHGHLDDEDEGGYPGEQSQYQEQGAEDLCEDDQDQGPAMPDMKRIEENGLLVAEMHHLGKSVVYTDQEAESEA